MPDSPAPVPLYRSQLPKQHLEPSRTLCSQEPHGPRNPLGQLGTVPAGTRSSAQLPCAEPRGEVSDRGAAAQPRPPRSCNEQRFKSE